MKKKLLTLPVIALLTCCSQKDIDLVSKPLPMPSNHKYQCYVDHIAKDYKSMGVRTLWSQYCLPKAFNGGMDTIPDQIYLNCDTDSIEHLYYLVDGKSHGTTFELTPKRIDTNRVNYYKCQ